MVSKVITRRRTVHAIIGSPSEVRHEIAALRLGDERQLRLRTGGAALPRSAIAAVGLQLPRGGIVQLPVENRRKARATERVRHGHHELDATAKVARTPVRRTDKEFGVTVI